jgi:hypothetical protein
VVDENIDLKTEKLQQFIGQNNGDLSSGSATNLFKSLLALRTQYLNAQTIPRQSVLAECEDQFREVTQKTLNLERRPATVDQALTCITEQAENIVKTVMNPLLNNLGPLSEKLAKGAELQRELQDSVQQLEKAHEVAQTQLKDLIQEGQKKIDELTNTETIAENTIKELEKAANDVLNKLLDVDFLKDLEETKNEVLRFLINIAEKAMEIIEKIILITLIAIIALSIASAWCPAVLPALQMMKTVFKFLQDALDIIKKVHSSLKMALEFSWGNLLLLAAKELGLTEKIDNLREELNIEEKLKEGIGKTIDEAKVKLVSDQVKETMEKSTSIRNQAAMLPRNLSIRPSPRSNNDNDIYN